MLCNIITLCYVTSIMLCIDVIFVRCFERLHQEGKKCLLKTGGASDILTCCVVIPQSFMQIDDKNYFMHIIWVKVCQRIY